jgi:hypothetical protein
LALIAAERMIRIATGQDSNASDSTTRVTIFATFVVLVALNVVRMTIAPSTNGSPKKTSANRDSSPSSQPPK